jgi:hypothetical protein
VRPDRDGRVPCPDCDGKGFVPGDEFPVFWLHRRHRVRCGRCRGECSILFTELPPPGPVENNGSACL